MTCREVAELLSSYLDDELDPEAHGLVEAHLQTCRHCNAVLEELRQVKSALQSLPVLEPPPELHARIMGAVAGAQAAQAEVEELETSPKPGRLRWKLPSLRRGGFRRVALALAACLVIMILSSAGTLFWARRYDAPLTSKGEADRSMGVPGLEGEQFFGMAEMPSGVEGEAIQRSGESGAEWSGEDYFTDAATAGIERKLIRRARLTLEVSQGGVDDVSRQAIHIVRSYQGYVESSSMSVAEGSQRSTAFYMTARVPSEHLDLAIDEISVLGRVTQEDIAEQDVTEQYVDLEARIKHKVQQEQRLLQIMGNANTVGELLQVEGELARVRTEIETLKGKQNVLEKSSAMSFLSVNIAEEGSRRSSPSYWGKIWKAFVEAWQDLAMFLARVAPAAILLVAGFFLVRRVMRKPGNG
ncbi:MAG: DUF4349 domain-containing protein [Bacillota bacterium]|nr:DUF4349 domain-containing protein [Candidatus Fermentithermobacillaceae bacterium]